MKFHKLHAAILFSTLIILALLDYHLFIVLNKIITNIIMFQKTIVRNKRIVNKHIEF